MIISVSKALNASSIISNDMCWAAVPCHAMPMHTQNTSVRVRVCRMSIKVAIKCICERCFGSSSAHVHNQFKIYITFNDRYYGWILFFVNICRRNIAVFNENSKFVSIEEKENENEKENRRKTKCDTTNTRKPDEGVFFSSIVQMQRASSYKKKTHRQNKLTPIVVFMSNKRWIA